jgi:multimeric flavodoxin WrbA
MQELYDKLLEADGIIYGTPAFFYGMTSQAKAIIDRTRCLRRPERCLVNKVAAGMVVGGSLGLISPLKDLYFYFVCNRMLPANFVAVYGDVRERPLGMKAAYDTGRQMVQVAAQKFKYHAEFHITILPTVRTHSSNVTIGK